MRTPRGGYRERIPTRDEILRLARERLGFDALRPGQAEAIESVTAGRDTLCVMSTGAGKSAIYQLAGMLIDGPTVVVSPLIALQQDQMDAVEDRAEGVEAATLNSTLTDRRREQLLEDVAQEEVEYVLLAPEQLANEDVLARLRDSGVSLFVVDEAHAVSQWGHDFRPDYLRVGPAIEALGHPPVLALTATAAPPVREEILQLLGMRDPKVVVKGFDRPNLHLSVERFHDEQRKHAALVERVRELASGGRIPGIVYCATRRGAEQLAERVVRAEWGEGTVGQIAEDHGDVRHRRLQDARPGPRARARAARAGTGGRLASTRSDAQQRAPDHDRAPWRTVVETTAWPQRLDAIDGIHAGGHTAQQRVRGRQRGIARRDDEELAARCAVRLVDRPRHADDAARVAQTPWRALDDAVAWTAPSVPAWIATLDHEAERDAVERQAVVVAPLHEPGHRRRGLGRAPDGEPDRDRTAVGPQHDRRATIRRESQLGTRNLAAPRRLGGVAADGGRRRLLACRLRLRAHADRDEPGGRCACETSDHRDPKRTGSVRSWFTKPETTYCGLPASCMPGKRRSVSSNRIRSSSRASAVPRQKWRPPAPNAWCSGLRRTSKRSGSS
jgi:hypothetical protein